MNVDLGGVRTSLTGGEGYKQALVAWLTPRRPDRGTRRPDVSFTLKEYAAPLPVGPADLVLGPIGIWAEGSRIRVSGSNGLGGQLDLSTRRGAVYAPTTGADRHSRAVLLAFRPLWHLALGRVGRHAVRAAGLVVDGAAILVVGPTGSGKSTLAVDLARHGAALLSDGAVFVDDTASLAYSAGERAALRADEAARLGVIGRRSVDDKTLVDVPHRVSSVRPDHLVFLDATVDGCTDVSAADAASRLLPSFAMGIDRAGDDRRAEVAAALASAVPALAIPARPDRAQIGELRRAISAVAAHQSA